MLDIRFDSDASNHIYLWREQVERGKWSDSVRNLRASTISWARRISWTSTLEADGESSYTSTCASYRGRRLHHLQFGHVNRNRVRNHVRQPTQMKTRLQFRPKPSPWLPTKWRHRLLHHTKINQTHRRRRQYQVRRVLRLRHLPRVVIPENLQPSNQELLDVIILFTPRFMKEIGGSDAVLAGKLEEDMLRDFSATGAHTAYCIRFEVYCGKKQNTSDNHPADKTKDLLL
ncbi:hypothetical protein PC118_g10281 [Phytophthora cactorum]|uniref:Uncharacterized protein n=1 Tax=Phytophthora cactorum TaxID=29920 RepID=A0A8T1FTJ0_9STRA|nr:hypothetical protein PC118_g10281 [Phytophthora cactorum]